MMNLFAKILSHGFALALVALLAIGLIYRGDLFPGLELPEYLSFGSPDDSDEPSETAQPEPVAPAADDEMAVTTAVGGAPSVEPAPLESAMPAPEAMEGADVGEPVMPALEAEVMAVETPVAPGPDTDLGETPDMAMPAESALEEMPMEPAPAEIEQGDVAPGIADEMESVPAPEPAAAMGEQGAGQEEPAAGETAGAGLTEAGLVTGDEAETAAVPEEPVADATAADTAGSAGETGEEIGKDSSYQLLAAAREAFWLRDYETAELKYRALIARDPVNPDGFGELGNMYFSQGDWEKAADAYYEAGIRLVDQGLTDRATQLVDVIRGLNGNQAGELEEKIRAAMHAGQ